jgi:ribosome maturation factor RimP
MADIKRIEIELEPVLAQEAAELVDLKFQQIGGRWVLRVFIDKHGGVGIDDCERLSKRIGATLDLHEDLIQGAYALEVSSPGLDRVIKKEKDFARFSGNRVKIRMKVAVDGRRRFNGYLQGIDGGQIILENDGQSVKLSLEHIDEARLDPEIKI